MKPKFALLFVLFLTIYIQAQQVNTNSSDKSNESTTAATKTSSTPNPSDTGKIVKVNGKVVLPPEKLKPVQVAKFTTPPVIDGKLDDEAWKTAPVLKDFYQTNPGDNIESSK